jgi:hypothetical protein
MERNQIRDSGVKHISDALRINTVSILSWHQWWLSLDWYILFTFPLNEATSSPGRYQSAQSPIQRWNRSGFSTTGRSVGLKFIPLPIPSLLPPIFKILITLLLDTYSRYLYFIQTLTTLNLSNNLIGHMGAEYVSDMLQANKVRLNNYFYSVCYYLFFNTDTQESWFFL